MWPRWGRGMKVDRSRQEQRNRRAMWLDRILGGIVVMKQLTQQCCGALNILLVGGCLLLMCACSSVGPSVDRQTYDLEKDKFVIVSLDGDVKLHGRRSIRRELSKESILEAAGGFADLSEISPESITLKRGTHEHVIPFRDMCTGKWKMFLLEDGDEIVVRRIVF